MTGDFSVRDLAELLNLREDEAETLKAVLSHCSKVGIGLGGTGAVGMAGAGTIIVPGVGAVPGWIVGFAAGWASGTLMCTMAHRGLVIEALKQIIGEARNTAVDDSQAVALLRTELDRLRNPERPGGYQLAGPVYGSRAGAG
jgi:hypothetical protein